jgi:hypothetical protein
MGNQEMREHLASLAFSEKVGIVDKLRGRSLTLAQARMNKETYIAKHLFNELRWLLCAATEWDIQQKLQQESVAHISVYTMDASFLHARALFEFFVKGPTGNHYSVKQFIGTVLDSIYYTDWAHPLHAHLMHAQDRSNPRTLNSPDGPKDLNEMPVYFSSEILRLWREFEYRLEQSRNPEDRKLHELARNKRKEAIEEARGVVDWHISRDHAQREGHPLRSPFPLID